MNEELLYNQLYEKTKDCGRTQFVRLLLDKERENKELKEQLEECQLQNFNLKEDIMIKKLSFPNREIKDNSLLELYNMPSYEELEQENKILNENNQSMQEEMAKTWAKLDKKEEIINEAKEKIKGVAYGGNEDYYIEKLKSVLKILDNKGSDK